MPASEGSVGQKLVSGELKNVMSRRGPSFDVRAWLGDWVPEKIYVRMAEADPRELRGLGPDHWSWLLGWDSGAARNQVEKYQGKWPCVSRVVARDEGPSSLACSSHRLPTRI